MEGLSAPAPSVSAPAPSGAPAPSSSPAPSSGAPAPGPGQSQNGIGGRNEQKQWDKAPGVYDERGLRGESKNDPTARPDRQEREGRMEGEEAESAAAERKRWQLKASGRDWDLGEEEVVKFAQKGIDADQKWQEAARMRQEANNLLRTLREDPMSILSHPKLGLDMEKIATDYLARKMEAEFMDPHERRAMEAEERLKSYEQREAEAREREVQAQREAEDYEYQTSVDRDIRSSLSQSGLPLTEFTYDSTIKYMQRAMKAGYRDVTPESVLPYVQRDFQRSQEQIYALPPDKMLEMIGEKGLEKIQQAYIEKIKGRRPEPQPYEASRSAPREPVKLSMEEWRQDTRRRMGIA